MVQILEDQPSFASQFLRSSMQTGTALGKELAGEYFSQKENKKRSKEFEDIFGFRAPSGVDIADLSSKLIAQREKDKSKSSFYKELLGDGFGMSENGGTSEFSSLSPQQETALALTNPNAFNAYLNLKQNQEKSQQKVQEKQNLEKTLEEMTNTLLEGRLGYTPKRFAAKGRRDVQYFDTLGTQLESIGKEMVSKGVLSAPRFAYLLSNLPSSNKTDAANAGSIEAWAQELGLEVPEIEKLKSLYESPEDLKKVKPGTPLDLEIMEKIYKKTGGDKEKAKSVAKKMGYKVE